MIKVKNLSPRCFVGIPTLGNPTNDTDLNLNGGYQVGRLETCLGCDNQWN